MSSQRAIGEPNFTHFALTNLTCDIAAGEVVAVVGPNGAGKTSLLKCILGLRDITSGHIELANKPLQAWSIQQRAALMSYVPQHTRSEFDLRVQDLVQMGRLPDPLLSVPSNSSDNKPANTNDHRHTQPMWWQWRKRWQLAQQHIAQALLAVGMANSGARLLSSLSGGELQRVLIARALVQQARILILDEPTNHLDVYYQHQILQLLKSLGLTVILTIHDLNLAAQYSDKVLLMNHGRLVASGTPEQVFTAARLTEVFRLPCAVQLVGDAPAIPSICFHAESDNAASPVQVTESE